MLEVPSVAYVSGCLHFENTADKKSFNVKGAGGGHSGDCLPIIQEYNNFSPQNTTAHRNLTVGII